VRIKWRWYFCEKKQNNRDAADAERRSDAGQNVDVWTMRGGLESVRFIEAEERKGTTLK